MKSVFILSLLFGSISYAGVDPSSFAGRWVGTCSSGANSFIVDFLFETNETDISIPFFESARVFSPFKDVETFSLTDTTSEDINMLRHKWTAKKSTYVVGSSLYTDALAVGIGVRSKRGEAHAIHQKSRFKLADDDTLEIAVAWSNKPPLAKKSLDTSPLFVCKSLKRVQ